VEGWVSEEMESVQRRRDREEESKEEG